MKCIGLCLSITLCVVAQERKTDPTFLHRSVMDLEAKNSDLTAPTCRYKPIFGEGDADARSLRGIARFGEMTVDPRGSSARVNYPAEEQVYVVLQGTGLLQYGDDMVPVRKNDFMYLPPGVAHGIVNSSETSCRLIVMGFRIPKGTETSPPPGILLSNIDDVKKEVVGGHPRPPFISCSWAISTAPGTSWLPHAS
ncbi:MAG TPA: cupin domain-containing protein [Acidobacteriota bacterium]|nr:cupin domain-containing protein [Acidobacteriota bacterium]